MRKKYKMQIQPHLLREQLRAHAQRQAPRIASWGWRPDKNELRDLRESTKDAISYRTFIRAWRSRGFRLSTIRKFAGRAPANRNATIRHFAAAQMEIGK
jgi:hypothetical protein